MDSKDLLRVFRKNCHQTPRPAQKWLLEHLPSGVDVTVCEASIGCGKTAVGLAYLLAGVEAGGRGWYLVPFKSLVAQVFRQYPKLKGVAVPLLGRSEYPCHDPRWDGTPADASPCNYIESPHHPRVTVTKSGARVGTHESPACEYPLAKAAAWNSPIVVTDLSYALFALAFQHLPKPDWIVIDEVDKSAELVRSTLTRSITNYRIQRAIELADEFAVHRVKSLENLLRVHNLLVERYEQKRKEQGLHYPLLIDADDLVEYKRAFNAVPVDDILHRFSSAVERGQKMSPEDYRMASEFWEHFARARQALEFALPRAPGEPMRSAVYAVKDPHREHATHAVEIKPGRVAGLIQRLAGDRGTLAMTGTLGNQAAFEAEIGLVGTILRAPSAKIDFPVVILDAKIDLRRRPGIRAMEDRAEALVHKLLRVPGVNALVLTSNFRQAGELYSVVQGNGIKALTYGRGQPAKGVVQQFMSDRTYTALIGPIHGSLGRGTDLPGRCNAVILYKPAFEVPATPLSQWEQQRFPDSWWARFFWRAGTQTAQAMGRVIRGPDDRAMALLVCESFQDHLTKLGLRPEVVEGARVMGPQKALAALRDFVERGGGAGPRGTARSVSRSRFSAKQRAGGGINRVKGGTLSNRDGDR